jgi:putative zinc finger/helix-turn-helix YgiT family protein
MNQPRNTAAPKCPECKQGQLVAFTRNEEFDFDLGDETVKVRAENVPVEKCDKCGEVLSGPAAAWVRHEAICRAAGLLTPSEIKAIREKFGWLQQHLADLTGLGIATISRCERGRLMQNRSTNVILLGLRDCAPFREYRERLLAGKTMQKPVCVESKASNRPLHDVPQRGMEACLPYTNSAPVNRCFKSRYSSPKDQGAYSEVGKGFQLHSHQN